MYNILYKNTGESLKISDDILAKFHGKKIGIIGDSISTFQGFLPSDIPGYNGATYAYYYPRGNVDNVNKTWWRKMAHTLGIEPSNISNCAWSGSRVTGNSASTTNAAAACSNRRISDLTLRGFIPDIIICYISCNDWGNDVALGTWAVNDSIPADGTISTMRAAYALMLDKLHRTYPHARIFCCTNLDDVARDRVAGYPPNNNNGVSVYQWNQNIIEIANALGCDVINLHECGLNYSNITRYAVDAGLHPNDAGHTIMAGKIAAELIAKYNNEYALIDKLSNESMVNANSVLYSTSFIPTEYERLQGHTITKIRLIPATAGKFTIRKGTSLTDANAVDVAELNFTAGMVGVATEFDVNIPVGENEIIGVGKSTDTGTFKYYYGSGKPDFYTYSFANRAIVVSNSTLAITWYGI